MRVTRLYNHENSVHFSLELLAIISVISEQPVNAMRPIALVWFRQDLRLADNPALTEALIRGYSVVPVYIYAPGEEGKWPPGGATKLWLHQSLKSLEGDLWA